MRSGCYIVIIIIIIIIFILNRPAAALPSFGALRCRSQFLLPSSSPSSSSFGASCIAYETYGRLDSKADMCNLKRLCHELAIDKGHAAGSLYHRLRLELEHRKVSPVAGYRHDIIIFVYCALCNGTFLKQSENHHHHHGPVLDC